MRTILFLLALFLTEFVAYYECSKDGSTAGSSRTNHASRQHMQHARHTKHKSRRSYYHHLDNNETLFILPIPSGPLDISKEWDIEMPVKSHFAGFAAPSDSER
jgi:hypothetical protein